MLHKIFKIFDSDGPWAVLVKKLESHPEERIGQIKSRFKRHEFSYYKQNLI